MTDRTATLSWNVPARYDAVTIGLHWATVLLVLVQFGTPMWWSYAPRPINFRLDLEDFHASLGLLLAAVLIVRLFWRVTAGRRLPEQPGLAGGLAQLVHWSLYILLLADTGLGIALRWLQGADNNFFGWVTLPALLARDRDAAELVETLHNGLAWAVMILAIGHAGAALWHHYGLRDRVLQRMLPFLR